MRHNQPLRSGRDLPLRMMLPFPTICCEQDLRHTAGTAYPPVLDQVIAELSTLQARHRCEIQACLVTWLRTQTKSSDCAQTGDGKDAELECAQDVNGSRALPSIPLVVPPGDIGNPVDLSKVILGGLETCVEPGSAHQMTEAPRACLKGEGSDAGSESALRPTTWHTTVQRFAKTLVSSPLFEIASVIVIIFSIIQTGVDLNNRGEESRLEIKDLHGPGIHAGYLTLVLLYSFEWFIRLVAEGSAFFTSKTERNWNLLDTGCLVGSILHVVHLAPLGLESFRIVRSIRILRVIKAGRHFVELRLMLLSIIGSFRALFWLIVILTCFLYIVGMILTHGALEYLSNNHAFGSPEHLVLEESFSTLPNSILSLLKAMVGGRSWGEYYDALVPAGRAYLAVFLVFICFSAFALTNVVTAVFVECARSSSDEATVIQAEQEAERTKAFKEKLKEAFEEIDSDKSGFLTREELDVALTQEHVQETLAGLGIDADHIDEVLEAVDTDSGGTVSAGEFVHTLMTSIRTASAFDITILRVQMRRLHAAVREFAKAQRASLPQEFADQAGDL